jgi:hypothetical protein
MKHQEEELGFHMGKMAGTLDQHYNITDVRISPHKFILPFPSSSELATQAAADLTRALLNPQPAGPFCQVGDDQAIALRRLANIFVSAKQKHANAKFAPKMKLRIVHLRGCTPRFHLRWWQAKT